MEGSRIFIPDDDHIWLMAEKLSHDISQNSLQVVVTDPIIAKSSAFLKRSVKLGSEYFPLQNDHPSDEGVDDMCSLNYLHEASILDNLRRRFESKLPYTYTSEICVAVNPYQWLNIYTKELGQEYSTLRKRSEMAPHVYATSSLAYQDLKQNERSQTIIVSGESGAGKTETVKILMNHIADISPCTNKSTVEKVLRSNPLLESFGNAKTCRNDNSSRFGKFIQLQFNGNVHLVGSRCVTYLLEKSRVVTQSSEERNYHIFYQIFSADEAMRERLCLTRKAPESFSYMSGSDLLTKEIEGKSDTQRYRATLDALQRDLSMSADLVLYIHQILAGILHLGELRFVMKASKDQEMCTISADTPVDVDMCQACCQLLGQSIESLTANLTTRTLDVEGRSIAVPLNVEQALINRDALAKEIYARLFQWLILVINYNTSFLPNQQLKHLDRIAAEGSATFMQLQRCDSLRSVHDPLDYKISLLDIFGFESFGTNRFEQFCINHANEKLQQLFTNDMIKSVQIEYQQEGLQWDSIAFSDNLEVIELVEGKRSIISMLNEEGMVPRGTDTGFLTKIRTAFKGKSMFSFDLKSRDTFTVHHYAGKVTYTVNGFLDRNKDTLVDNVKAFMSQSANPLLQCLFTNNRLYGNEQVEINDDAVFRSLSDLQEDESDDMVCGAEADLNVAARLNYQFVDLGATGVVTPKMGSESGSTKSVEPSALRRALSAKNLNPSPRPELVSAQSMRLSPTRRQSFILSDTITSKFKLQLQSLLFSIEGTRVHYIRCIKPNPLKSNIVFHRPMVVEQLRSAGMIEAVKISRAAYPYRQSHTEFIRRFCCLSRDAAHSFEVQSFKDEDAEGSSSSTQQMLKELLKEFLAGQKPRHQYSEHAKLYEVGKSRIYFTAGVLEILEEKRRLHADKCLVQIQKIARGWVRRRFYRLARRALDKIQSSVHRWRAVKSYRAVRAAVVKIQAQIRRFAAYLRVQGIREWILAVCVQSLWRMRRARTSFMKRRTAAVAVQARVRSFLARKSYLVNKEQARIKADLVLQLFSLQSQVAELTAANEKLASQAVEDRQRIAVLVKELEAAREDSSASQQLLNVNIPDTPTLPEEGAPVDDHRETQTVLSALDREGTQCSPLVRENAAEHFLVEELDLDRATTADSATATTCSNVAEEMQQIRQQLDEALDRLRDEQAASNQLKRALDEALQQRWMPDPVQHAVEIRNAGKEMALRCLQSEVAGVRNHHTALKGDVGRSTAEFASELLLMQRTLLARCDSKKHILSTETESAVCIKDSANDTIGAQKRARKQGETGFLPKKVSWRADTKLPAPALRPPQFSSLQEELQWYYRLMCDELCSHGEVEVRKGFQPRGLLARLTPLECCGLAIVLLVVYHATRHSLGL